MKRKFSSELRRTSAKIKHYIDNPAPDRMERQNSAIATQAGIAFRLEELEVQPSKAGKRRKGYKSPHRRAIEVICGKLDHPDLQSVLAALEDNDSIEDMYEAIPSPIIDIHTIEICHDSKEMKFTLRTGYEKAIAFKTIQNLINMYKYEKSAPD